MFLLVIAMGIFPLLFLTLVVLGVGVQWIQWAPPVVWNDRFGTSNGNGATAIVFDNSSLYVAGYVNVTVGVQVFDINTPVWYGETFLSRYDLDGHRAWTSMVSSNYSSIQSDPPPSTPGISIVVLVE